MKTRTLPPRNLISRSPLRAFLLTSFVLAYLAFSPRAQAVIPAPDGGYPGENTAEGTDALFGLTTGIHNTATGYKTLFSNTIGFNNTAIGWETMDRNTTGSKNTAVGCDGLDKNTTGSQNTAMGTLALVNNTTGNGNIALGFQAGQNITDGNDNIDIGNPGAPGETSTIHVGTQGIQANTFIAGISGATIADGVTVVVGSDGHLGTIASSERYKDAIQPMDEASEAILALKPVTFRYKHELDRKGVPQFGLMAEQVEKVNPDLVARDGQGKPYTVRYEAVNAMLLNEFLKEHKKVEQLEATVAKLAAAVEKVSAQLQVSKPTPQVVLNNQ